jgi:hypothetical protein
MTELKTLKDIHKYCWYGDEQIAENFKFVKIDDLKQEAIKWVKERKFLSVPKGVEPHVHHAYMHGEREFIKHFFNLTEADLIELKGGIIDNE